MPPRARHSRDSFDWFIKDPCTTMEVVSIVAESLQNWLDGHTSQTILNIGAPPLLYRSGGNFAARLRLSFAQVCHTSACDAKRPFRNSKFNKTLKFRAHLHTHPLMANESQMWHARVNLLFALLRMPNFASISLYCRPCGEIKRQNTAILTNF